MVSNLRQYSTSVFKTGERFLLNFTTFPGKASQVSNQITTQAKNENLSSWYVRGLDISSFKCLPLSG